MGRSFSTERVLTSFISAARDASRSRRPEEEESCKIRSSTASTETFPAPPPPVPGTRGKLGFSLLLPPASLLEVPAEALRVSAQQEIEQESENRKSAREPGANDKRSEVTAPKATRPLSPQGPRPLGSSVLGRSVCGQTRHGGVRVLRPPRQDTRTSTSHLREICRPCTSFDGYRCKLRGISGHCRDQPTKCGVCSKRKSAASTDNGEGHTYPSAARQWERPCGYLHAHARRRRDRVRFRATYGWTVR